MRAAISRRRWRCLQTARKKTGRDVAELSSRMQRVLLRHVAELDAGLGRKEEAIREALRAVDIKPIAKDSLQRSTQVARTWRWFTRGRASAIARSSNSKLSRRSRPGQHTAISASIRAGIICAVIRASTRSLPQPRLPADSRHEIFTN